MTGRARRARHPIPRISACENVGAYSKDQIRGIAEYLRSTRPWVRLYEAANGWKAAGESLELVSDTLKEVGRALAGGCRSQDAAACQEALQRLDATARHLAYRSRQLERYTSESANVLATGTERFPTDEPGFAERILGETVGGAVDRVNPFHKGPSEEDYRQALAALNNDYLMVNSVLPRDVSAEFSQFGDADFDDPDEDEATSGGGGTPTAGGPAVGAGAGGATSMGSVPVAPSGGGGTSAADPVPVVGDLSGSGSTGGLSGAAPMAPPAGAGAGPGVPVGPGAPAAGPVGAGPVAAPVVAGAGRPPMVQPGVVGAASGSQPAGSSVARGAGASGAGAARLGATPGVIGGQPAGQAAGRGVTGAASGRAAAGAPVGGAGRRGEREDSARDTWLVEDEDLWADPAAAPSVIE